MRAWFAAWVGAEQDRFLLLLPVAMGAAILGYFALPHEPPLWLGSAAAAAACALVALAALWRFPPGRLVAALALAAAHAAGVVHRDIKPENIMARADGHVKVVDFGLARLLPAGYPGSIPESWPANVSGGILAATDSATDSATNCAMIAGTLSYMSPEQTRSEPAGSASDVFSLGIILYEVLCGAHPFRASTVLDTLNAIITKDPPPCPAGPKRKG